MPISLASANFYAHHSPFGAFASFTLGRYDKGGGFGLELSGPANQDVYVALLKPGEPVRALPFYAGAQQSRVAVGGAEAYTGQADQPEQTEAAATSKTQPLAWQVWGSDEIRREIGWASDAWSAGDLTFRLLTPFGEVPEPTNLSDDALRRALCPAILAEITVDNTDGGEDAWAFFGIGASDPLRPLSDSEETLVGIAGETGWGFAVRHETGQPEHAAREVLTWSLQQEIARAALHQTPLVHRLSNRGGVLLRALPGERRTYTLALGFFRDGIVTSGVRARYLYSRVFRDLENVLTFALDHADALKQSADERDAELDAAPLTDSRKFLLAHATHSYHGATMLLHDEDDVLQSRSDTHRPLWVVNEGEYRMLNTFDLTVDHAFFEMRYHPWTLRNTLDLFVRRYRYTDDVQDATDAQRPHFPGGVSFTHDMGVANQFSPPGYSSYERPNLIDCFSYMTQEQLCNWCLCAALYGLPSLYSSGDSRWLAGQSEILRDCLTSMVHRDGPDPLRNGVMSLDSTRCGSAGQEITTYDSLDASLGQARANGYIAVKSWAAYLALSRCLDALGEEASAALAEEQAAHAAATISRHYDRKSRCLPAVFDENCAGFTSRIIPAIEGLIYPFVLGDGVALAEDGPYGELLTLLREHLETVLQPGICLDTTSGGFKLSSASENTWMSKIFLCQAVAEQVLGVTLSESYDIAHARWQTDGACRDYAFTDQVRSTDGYDLGSRYYPRGVTAILWLPHE